MLLLQTMMFFLLTLTLPRNSKALPNRHIRLGLRHQRIANILFTPCSPRLVVLLAERPDGHVAITTHEFAGGRSGLGGDGVNVHFQFFTVGFKGQVIDVVSEGVFDFAANG